MRYTPSRNPLFGILYSALFATLLTACNGSNKTSINKEIDDATRNKESTFTFVNGTDEIVSFYLNYRDSSNNIYDEEYNITSVLSGEYSEPYIYSWSEFLRYGEVAVSDSNTLTHKANVQLSLEDKKSYTAIAWLDGTQFSLRVQEAPNHQDSDTFGVRFFSSIDQNLSFPENTVPDVVLEKGEVSDIITVENCGDIAVVNEVDSNLCQIANMGGSYIVVIMAGGEVAVMEE